MGWGYRKSVRLPMGFRLNVSKHGLGYSWGFTGFRTGRDGRGKQYRYLSIPHTGIFYRSYAQPGYQPKTSHKVVGFLIALFVFRFLWAVLTGN